MLLLGLDQIADVELPLTEQAEVTWLVGLRSLPLASLSISSRVVGGATSGRNEVCRMATPPTWL